MERIAEGLEHVKGFPKWGINVYVAGGLLVDAGTKIDAKRILRDVGSRSLRAHVVTHCHPDHQGSTHAVAEALGLDVWVHEVDADGIEAGDVTASSPDTAMMRFQGKFVAGPGHPVARRLVEGDDLGEGWTVLHTPGHSPGHMSLWRESDRTLICGDAFFGQSFTGLGKPGPRRPAHFVTVDPALAVRSMRKLAELEPALAVFGHGPPVRDPAEMLHAVERAEAEAAAKG